MVLRINKMVKKMKDLVGEMRDKGEDIVEGIKDKGEDIAEGIKDMVGDSTVVKTVANTVANNAKRFEESFARDSVLLKGFTRSLQMDDCSCGAQCANVVLKYYRKDWSIQDVIGEFGSISNGIDQHQLRRLFEHTGLKPVQLKSPTITKIKREIDQGFPVLVSICEGDHWVVIYGYGNGSIFVADPAVTCLRCRQSTSQFMKKWDKWAMVIRTKELMSTNIANTQQAVKRRGWLRRCRCCGMRSPIEMILCKKGCGYLCYRCHIKAWKKKRRNPNSHKCPKCGGPTFNYY